MVRHEDQLLIPADPTEGYIYSFTERTGELNWKWPSGSGVSSDLMVVDGRLIAVTLDNELVALDVATGENLWTTAGVTGFRPASPTTPTPVVFEGDIIWGRQDGQLSRRNVASGEAIWSVNLGEEMSTDLLLHNGTVTLGLADGRLLQIDPREGKLLNENQLNGLPTYRWTPVGDEWIVGLTGVTGTGRELICVDAHTLAVQWKMSAPDPYQWTTSQPTQAWGMVLVGTNGLLLYGIDAASGDVIWRAEVEQAPRTIKVVGDLIYMGTFGGTLLAYRR